MLQLFQTVHCTARIIMRFLLIVLSLAVVDCIRLPWNSLNTFQESFWEARLSAERTIDLVNEILRNRTEDSYNFTKEIENSEMVQGRFTSGLENSGCPNKFEDLKKRFRTACNRLDVPLLQRVAEIKRRLSAIGSKLIYYQSVADNKYWSCRLSKGKECVDEIERWLQQKLLSLSCEMTECESHIIKKREDGLFKCLNSIEIPEFFYCDGMDDCGDNSDEENCFQNNSNDTTNCNLKLGTYLCKNNKCVNASSVCDGIDNCGDRSDENNCTNTKVYITPNCSIEHGTYLCGNKKCINASSVCNGNDDCGDRSDENNCTKVYSGTNCSLEHGTYLCGNKKYISLSSVCDGNDDCGDGTDEGGNCNESCQQECHPRGVCFRTPESKHCLNLCPQGFFETASGCQRSMEPDLSPVSQLVLDVDRLISRHSSAYLLLKTKTISEILMFSFPNYCDYKYPKLDEITEIQDGTFKIQARMGKGSR